MPTLNELLHAASRTFAIGIDLLPGPLRKEIEVAYLLLRVSDYLEDNESMAPEAKAELLERWAAVVDGSVELERIAPELEEAPEQTPDALVARHVRPVHEGFRSLRPAAREIIARHVRESTLGMARWALRGPDIADESDLDDYMHEVAGRVGWLLTELFALDVPAVEEDRERMMGLGREFGLALQTVNVIRGLHSDWERGWIYIPRSFVPAGGPLPEELFGRGRGEGTGAASRRATATVGDVEMAVLEKLVEKADRHLDAARRYIVRIPRRHHGIRLFCLLPLLFAVRTLAVSRGNAGVFEEETKIRRPEVRRIVRNARFFAVSNRWIAWYCRRLDGKARPDG